MNLIKMKQILIFVGPKYILFGYNSVFVPSSFEFVILHNILLSVKVWYLNAETKTYFFESAISAEKQNEWQKK